MSIVSLVHTKLATLEQGGDPLDDVVRGIVGSTARSMVIVDFVRFPGKGSKIFTVVRSDPFTPPGEVAGFAREKTPDVIKFLRPGENLLVWPADGQIEHTIEGEDVAADDAQRALAAVPALAAFAPLAGGCATLTAFGLAWHAKLGRIGLVQIHRDLERYELDEAALRAAGFGETSEEGLWSTPDGATSLVWMGGTVYGYLGPVPELVGGWTEP